MERAYLRNFGLEEEQIDQILNKVSNELGKKIKEYEQKLEAQEQSYSSLNDELTTANATIETLKKSNKDNETLQAQVEAYKKDIEAVKQKAEADRVDMTIKMALTNAGAINPVTVMPLVNRDAIVVGKDGTIAGIDEQLQQILSNEDNRYLFKQEETIVNEPTRGGYNPDNGFTKESDPTFGKQELNIGQLIGQEMHEQKSSKSTQQAVDSFWNSYSI